MSASCPPTGCSEHFCQNGLRQAPQNEPYRCPGPCRDKVLCLTGFNCLHHSTATGLRIDNKGCVLHLLVYLGTNITGVQSGHTNGRATLFQFDTQRSEERRVGKEGIARWRG